MPYAHIFSSVPDLVLGLAFLATWIDPPVLGDDMLNTLGILIFMEFFIIHSAAFMTVVIFLKQSKWKKFLMLTGLGLFYSLFVVAFTHEYGEWWPLGSFWVLIANRMLSMLSNPTPDDKNIFIPAAAWAISLFFYIIGIFLFEFISVPDFGITELYAEAFVVDNFWVQGADSVMAFGFFYFFSVGIFELFIIKKLAKANNIQL